MYGLLQVSQGRSRKAGKLLKLTKSCSKKWMSLNRSVDVIVIFVFSVTVLLFIFAGIEGLCMLLRRLAYPNRLSDLESLFGVSAEYISVITNIVLEEIIRSKGHLLDNLGNLRWLQMEKLRYYANVSYGI